MLDDFFVYTNAASCKDGLCTVAANAIKCLLDECEKVARLFYGEACKLAERVISSLQKCGCFAWLSLFCKFTKKPYNCHVVGVLFCSCGKNGDTEAMV